MKILEKVASRYLKKHGYTIESHAIERSSAGYRLLSYNSYDEYKAIQIEGNKAKLSNVWADETTIHLICDYLVKDGNVIRRGLCHGSRNGTELGWFRKYLSAEIVGTDISDTAPQFGLTQWDFHDSKHEWIGQFDFVYTNSHDHAYDPKKAFDTWIEQLVPGGALFIEHTTSHAERAVTALDPLGIDPEILPFTILQFSGGRYCVTEVLKPQHRKHDSDIWVFVIEPHRKPRQPAFERP
ncbi:hypothetical protein [Labrys sp. (in: a-proteobacteria)]|uniref:hypothetical protein n=1 Tax=Labrys sp. (in: a-proteobacteria) TaxID=1917972 RepID=UPI0039E24C9A